VKLQPGERWFEASPCTCEHDKGDHDINGCRHSYLSTPPCTCSGVFGIANDLTWEQHVEKMHEGTP
jgi:hypothetical protein